MKKILLILLLSFCVLSCAKTKSLGAGVSVDAQGNLKIDAPLYVIDTSAEKPGLKRAPASMNLPVYAGIPIGDTSTTLEVTGGIVKGRISITIKLPDEYWLNYAKYFWDVPDDSFTSGADVEIGELYLAVHGSDYYYRIFLYPNLNVQVLTGERAAHYYIEGGRYAHIYSLGSVNISGKVSVPRWYNWKQHFEFGINFNSGWNVIREGSYFDETLQDDVLTKTSAIPPSSAVWVLFE
jgi:hypothetical protein